MSAELHRITPAGPLFEPPKSVVELAEELLQRVKRGEIKGVAIACVDATDSVTTTWESGCASGSLMVSASSVLAARVTRQLLEQDSCDFPPKDAS